MTLRDRYARALSAALARETPEAPGVSAWEKLQNGAQFAVKVHGRRRQVILARQHTPVGFPTEEATFCRHFEVPTFARRQDLGRAADGWYKVAYTWEVSGAASAEATQQELAPAADGDLPQFAPGEAKAPAGSDVTQLLAEGERLPEGL